ncbi:hypothetical protein Tco_1189029 [Tanacetum coccineum]
MITLKPCNKHNIVNWEYILLDMTEAKDSEVCKITRADGTSSFPGDFQALLRRLDRQDLFQLYSLVQERYKHSSIKGHDLDLWGDLKMMFDSNEEVDIWLNQHYWELLRQEVSTEEGILKKMINLKIEAEEESDMASELIKGGLLGIKELRQDMLLENLVPLVEELSTNDDILPWGNNKCKEKGEDGLEWVVKSKFEGELANFMLEKKFHTKGIGEMLDEHRNGMREQFSQILSIIKKSEIPEPEAPTFDVPSKSTPTNHAKGAKEKEGPKGAESSSMDEEAPRSSVFYQPSKSSNMPFPSRVKKQKKDDEDERLLSIFKKIHINLPFLEAMIYMPKGSEVLKDLLSHKEKLEKAASSVKLSEESYAII